MFDRYTCALVVNMVGAALLAMVGVKVFVLPALSWWGVVLPVFVLAGAVVLVLLVMVGARALSYIGLWCFRWWKGKV